MILARTHRCSSGCFYTFSENQWVWGELYDFSLKDNNPDPVEENRVVSPLFYEKIRHEQPITQASLLKAMARVLYKQGKRQKANQHWQLAHIICGQAPEVVQRSGIHFFKRLKRKVRIQALWTLLMVSIFLVFPGSWLIMGAAVGSLLWTCVVAIKSWHRKKRYENLLSMCKFECQVSPYS